MLYSNSTGVSVPHVLTPLQLVQPYTAGQVNYRDSSWLKLTVCELFLKNECPNVENCSLAHPPNTVKIENNTVTICYDYIKKRDCKHEICKYYHPHDALSNAILRRGDDNKKNGAINNLGLPINVPNNYHLNRMSKDLINLQAAQLLSSQFTHPGFISNDQQMKAKLEIMRQMNAASANAAILNSANHHPWYPTIPTSLANLHNLSTGQSVVGTQQNQLVPGIPTQQQLPVQNYLLLNPSSASYASSISSISNHNNAFINNHNSITTNNTSTSITSTHQKVGLKRPAAEAFGINNENDVNVLVANSQDNADIKKVKKESEIATSTHVIPMNTNLTPYSTTVPQHLTMPMVTNNNLLASSHNLALQTLLNTPAVTSVAGLQPTQPYTTLPHHLQHAQTLLDPNLLALSQKLYSPASHLLTNPNTPTSTYPQLNLAATLPNATINPLFSQLYYQQLLQAPLGSPAGLVYPTANVNLLEFQQRSIEETSVAFINDKGAILETLPVCKDFLSGKCKRSQSCNYVHLLDNNVEVKDCKLTVCKNALKGQCHRSVCKFYHIPPYQLQKLGVSNMQIH